MLSAIAFLLMGILFFSCGDTYNDQEDHQVLTNRADRNGGTTDNNELILTLSSSVQEHEDFARELSHLFSDPRVRAKYADYLKRQPDDETVLLADFIFTMILSEDSAVRMDDKIKVDESFFSCDFVKGYLNKYPGIEGAFVDFNDTIPVNLMAKDFTYEVFLVYDDTDDAPGFVNGEKVNTYDIHEVPDGNTFKISMGDYYYVSKSVDSKGNGFRIQFADLFTCESLVEYVNNKNKSNDLYFGGLACGMAHPLKGLNVITQDDLLGFFNGNCGVPPGGVVGPGPGPRPDMRSTDCDRDLLRNERETLLDVRSVNGKSILRDCDTWCARRDKNCVFQVDVIIPTSSPDDEDEFEVFGTIKKVISTGERRLRKNWESDRLRDHPLPITEWLFLEGYHGNEWQYSWTGRHRHRGITIEQNHGISLSTKVGFKIGDLGVDKENKGSSSVKITRANEDCFLGDDISRYCRPLRERLYAGDLYFLVSEQGF